jgi:hypothetical protein
MANVAMTTNTQSKSMGVVNHSSGKIVTDAGSPAVAQTVDVGFTPRVVRIKVTAGTNPDMYEWFEGMTAAHAIVTTGSTGVVTKITSAGITVAAGQITFGATIMVASETFYWEAVG